MSDPRRLIILGEGLFSEIAHEYFTHDSDYEVVAFAVEAEYRKEDTFLELPVVDFEDLEELYPPAEHAVYAAIVYTQVNRLRKRLADAAKAKGYSLASYVSSSAFVAKSATIGEHAFIFEDNTIQPRVTIGDNCVVWSGNHVGHHSTIRDNVFISSHVCIAGGVTIGDNCFLGINSTIVNDVEVGADVWLGPAVTITRSVDPNTTWRAPRSEVHPKSTAELFGITDAAGA
jgi:sugar O-acyltransferase (sialic acid O-acetyltransferase NeuD family)